ncbi:MAG: hypothetical protein EOM76_09175 [Sphingobacteriia bacterium]|nr:hypothetical protein [Sphingobacteriia bacterium]
MIIAVDFDGTIVEHAYPAIGRPIPFAFDVLKRLQDENHHQLILWSVREGALLEEAVEFCRSNGLEFYAVNKNYPEEKSEDGTSRKLNVDIYIDDRNVGGLPDWGVIYRMIKFGESIREAYLNNDMIPPKKNFLQKILGL